MPGRCGRWVHQGAWDRIPALTCLYQTCPGLHPLGCGDKRPPKPRWGGRPVWAETALRQAARRRATARDQRDMVEEYRKRMRSGEQEGAHTKARGPPPAAAAAAALVLGQLASLTW